MSEDVKHSKRRAGLGRGLGALLGDTQREEAVVPQGLTGGKAAGGDGLVLLPVASIEPHPDNPRVHFDEDALADLAKSIASRGVIQPIIVRPTANGRYQLVAGERRWRAAQKARLHQIPAIVRELEDREVTALALIENIQREDLNPVEEARAYKRLGEREGMTQAEIARMVEKSRSHVANLTRLLNLPESVLKLVETDALSMGHARALINCDAAEAIAREAAAKKLSVRDVEKMVRRSSAPAKEPRRAARSPGAHEDADIRAIQNNLEELLGLPVTIAADADPAAGQVTIRYKTLDQLDLVCQRLTGGAI